MKRKLLSQVKFNNGAYFKCYLHGDPPGLAKKANDHIELSVIPGKGRGEKFGFFLNIYDANNLIFILSAAILETLEAGYETMPSKTK